MSVESEWTLSGGIVQTSLTSCHRSLFILFNHIVFGVIFKIIGDIQIRRQSILKTAIHYKKITWVLSFISLCLLLISCSKSSSPDMTTNSPATPNTPNATTQTTEPIPVDPIREKIDRMSTDEKIGQMVIVGLEGTSMQADAEELISSYRVGGFILYQDNISDANQTLKLLNQLKVANQGNIEPLWLSVDQEGGKVDRMPEEFSSIPTAKKVGQVNNTQYSNQIGQVLGQEVRALGFNLNYAPVLDINSNPKNPVIGSRAFGADPETVIRHGIEVMKGIQSQQVAAVVKHFPGHGDTSVDSHLALPVIQKSLDDLKAFELLPFVEAIKQKTDAIMVAHLLLPKIDDKNPASLSSTLITDLLRGTLGYDGVVITDDMTMGGISENYEIGEAAVKSVQAGSDIVLVGHNFDQQVAVLKNLKKGVESGELTTARLDDSVYRILKLKEKYKITNAPNESIDVDEVNSHIHAALDMGKAKK